MTPHDLARRGFRVFPLKPNSKLPAIKNWPQLATTDLDQVTKWFGQDGDATWADRHNVGVATGHGLVALDVDNKNGKNGSASLMALELVHGDLPDTFTVETPTGGKHVYFTLSEQDDLDIRNSSSKLGQGIDVRAAGGFVVGPGSVLEGARYRRTNDSPVAPLPERILGAFEVKRDPVARLETSTDIDTPDAIKRAADHLKNAEPAVEGAGGDQHTYTVAAKILDFGLSPQAALDLMLEHWNERCQPPWSPDDLKTKIDNAAKYRTSPIGVASPQADFTPVDLDAQTPHKAKLYYEKFKAIRPDFKTKPLIKDYLDQQAFSVLYGESHVGKTFVALDMAFSVSTGRAFADHKTHHGLVIYVAAEGGRGIHKRIEALKRSTGVPDAAMAVVPCGLSLVGRRSDTDELIALIGKAEVDFGRPAVLVVIDTLSRAMSGANENASEDMTAFVSAIDRIRAATSAHVMVVHHAGKDTSKGARGHSSLRAATDTELEIEAGVLRVRKQRDGEHCGDRGFALSVVDVGAGSDGVSITSCVVAWVPPGAEFNVSLSPMAKQALDMLTNATSENATKAIKLDTWRDIFKQGVTSCKSNAFRQRWRRVTDELCNAGWVKIVGDSVAYVQRDIA